MKPVNPDLSSALQLKDKSTVCIRHPYNIKICVPCPPPAIPKTLPVVVRLENANGRLAREQSNRWHRICYGVIPVRRPETSASARTSSRTGCTT
jgi:hypothetical protein